MIVNSILELAGVPTGLRAEALLCFEQSKQRQPSHLRKHWVRLMKAGKIASLLDWGDNRLIDKHPELADWDIAPVLNVTCNGDNGPWIVDETGQGKPYENSWLDRDTASVEYALACQRNYWLMGHHPRSPEARKAWYRRNACEYMAWSKGMPIDPAMPMQEWTENGVTVLKCGRVWQAKGTLQILGPLRWKFDIGYEVGNVFARINNRWVQSWYPLPGYELRACVCWVVYPVILKTEV